MIEVNVFLTGKCAMATSIVQMNQTRAQPFAVSVKVIVVFWLSYSAILLSVLLSSMLVVILLICLLLSC